MSVLVTNEIRRRSRSSGNSMLVLLCFGEHVNHYKAERGEPWLAWPSEERVASLCNCSDRAVRRAKRDLKELGELVDTGEFVGRGCRVYEISLPAEPRTSPSTLDEDGRTQAATLDESDRGGEADEGDPGRLRPPGRTDSVKPRTGSSGTPDGIVRPGRTGSSAEQEGKGEEKKEEKNMRKMSAAVAPDGHSFSFSTANCTVRRAELKAEIAALEVDLSRRPDSTMTAAALKAAKAELERLEVGA